jgi:hypothetical protein
MSQVSHQPVAITHENDAYTRPNLARSVFFGDGGYPSKCLDSCSHFHHFRIRGSAAKVVQPHVPLARRMQS